MVLKKGRFLDLVNRRVGHNFAMSDSLSTILSTIHQETLLQYLDETQQRNLHYDLIQFNKLYPGGICSYINNAVNLLDASLSGNTQISGIDVLLFTLFLI